MFICETCGHIAEVPNADYLCPDCNTLLVPTTQEDEHSPIKEMVGRRFIEKYKIIGYLGKGGSCTVWKGVHLLTEQTVAIKILHNEMAVNKLAVRRFQREAKAACKIKHPNVVRVMDFGTTEYSEVYLVMEYVEGRTLRKIIATDSPLSYPRIFGLLLQICGALDAAHRCGIIHRDLKPENIMVTPSVEGEHVCVLDFGIAKMFEHEGEETPLTAADSILGTPNYMSPEQARGVELDYRSDIYSLGIVVYELVCGVTPFPKDQPQLTLIRHIRTPPPPLTVHRRDVAPALEALVMSCLQKEPSNRPSTVMHFAQNLRAVFGADSTSGQNLTPSGSFGYPQPLDQGSGSGSGSTPKTLSAPVRTPSDSQDPLEVDTPLQIASLLGGQKTPPQSEIPPTQKVPVSSGQQKRAETEEPPRPASSRFSEESLFLWIWVLMSGGAVLFILYLLFFQ